MNIESSKAVKKLGFYLSLNIAFGFFVGGQIASGVGSQISDFVVGLFMADAPGAAGVIGYGAIQFLILVPSAFVSIIGGYVADRVDRRLLIGVSDALMATLILGFLILYLTIGISPLLVYVIIFLRSILSGFQSPAATAIIPQLVEKENLSKVNGLFQASFALSLIIAPVVGAITYDTIGLVPGISIDLITFLLAICALGSLYLVRDFPEQKSDAEENEKLLSAIMAGLTYIRNKDGLLQLYIFAAISYIFHGVLLALYVPMVRGFLTDSALGAAFGISLFGGIISGAVFGFSQSPKRPVRTMLFFHLGIGIGMLIIAIRPAFIPLVVGGFLFWFVQVGAAVTRSAIWQAIAPETLQGRVQSAVLIANTFGLGLSLLIFTALGATVFDVLSTNSALLGNTIIADIFGVGAGRGLALVIFGAGILEIIYIIFFFQFKKLLALDDMNIFETVTIDEVSSK